MTAESVRAFPFVISCIYNLRCANLSARTEAAMTSTRRAKYSHRFIFCGLFLPSHRANSLDLLRNAAALSFGCLAS